MEYQRRVKHAFDKHVAPNSFQPGDLVFQKLEATGKPVGKLQCTWDGPYKVIRARGVWYFGHKDDMVKCRKCGYWYHPWCVDEHDRDGRADPYFSFWLCLKCKPDPKQDPGYKFTYRPKADIEKDIHYEDTDFEMEPDYKLWT